MDKIIIKDAGFSCNLGITKKERNKKQEIFVDIEMFYGIKKAADSDSIKDAINYSEVYGKVKQLIENKQYNLIETIAEDIADFILRKFDAKKIHILVRKPNAIKEAKYAAVEITRKK